MKKNIFILIYLVCSINTILINAFPNTAQSCTEDKACQEFNCPNNPNPSAYNAPVKKCKTNNLFGREIKYCYCEYADKNPKSKDSAFEIIYKVKECTDPSACDGVTCPSGAHPQCDATDNGICYCPQ